MCLFLFVVDYCARAMGNLCGKPPPQPRPPTPPTTVVVKEARLVEKDGALPEPAEAARDRPMPNNVDLFSADALHVAVRGDKPAIVYHRLMMLTVTQDEKNEPPHVVEQARDATADIIPPASPSHVQASHPGGLWHVIHAAYMLTHCTGTPKPRVPTPIVPIVPQLSKHITDPDPPKPATDPEDSWRVLQKTYSKPAPATPPSPIEEATPIDIQPPSQVDVLATQPSVPEFVAMGGGEVLTLADEAASQHEEDDPAAEAMEAGPSLSTLGAGAERVVFLET